MALNGWIQIAPLSPYTKLELANLSPIHLKSHQWTILVQFMKQELEILFETHAPYVIDFFFAWEIWI